MTVISKKFNTLFCDKLDDFMLVLDFQSESSIPELSRKYKNLTIRNLDLRDKTEDKLDGDKLLKTLRLAGSYLRVLKLRNCRVTQEFFGCFPNLFSLKTYHTSIIGMSSPKTKDYFPDLIELELFDISFDEVPVLKAVTTLETLVLHRAVVIDEFVSKQKKLKYLSIEGRFSYSPKVKLLFQLKAFRVSCEIKDSRRTTELYQLKHFLETQHELEKITINIWSRIFKEPANIRSLCINPNLDINPCGFYEVIEQALRSNVLNELNITHETCIQDGLELLQFENSQYYSEHVLYSKVQNAFQMINIVKKNIIKFCLCIDAISDLLLTNINNIFPNLQKFEIRLEVRKKSLGKKSLSLLTSFKSLVSLNLQAVDIDQLRNVHIENLETLVITICNFNTFDWNSFVKNHSKLKRIRIVEQSDDFSLEPFLQKLVEALLNGLGELESLIIHSELNRLNISMSKKMKTLIDKRNLALRNVKIFDEVFC